MMKRTLLLLIFLVTFGCKNKLDLKPSSNIVLPKSAADLEAILENSDFINTTPSLLQVSADEYFIVNQSAWQSTLTATERNASIWSDDIYNGEIQVRDWTFPYKAIFSANSVLDILSTMDISQDLNLQRIKGRALFIRGYAFYNLVSTFAKAYNSNSSSSDLGIPLKLNGSVEGVAQRSTVQQTYDQIIMDIQAASDLLNNQVIDSKRNQPSKVAAFALLARIYTSMRKYDEALTNAEKALSIYPKLIDFNGLNPNTNNPFDDNSQETIYYSYATGNGGTFFSRSSSSTAYGVVTSLLNSYEQNDLRRSIYFRKNTVGNFTVKAINTAVLPAFSGLATDELYLIKAECLARAKQNSEARNALNILLKTRYITNQFLPISIDNNNQLLDRILLERQKSLIFRSVRWTDLKRLNLEGREITISREFGNNFYQLLPNSPKYVLPIPTDEIQLSGITQNPR